MYSIYTAVQTFVLQMEFILVNLVSVFIFNKIIKQIPLYKLGDEIEDR